jgi:hypothetical protein
VSLRLPALCLAALALLGAGCGESEREKYEGEMDEIGQRLERELTQVGRDIQSSGGLELAAPEIEKGADLLDRTARELAELEPPEDARRPHARIVSGSAGSRATSAAPPRPPGRAGRTRC